MLEIFNLKERVRGSGEVAIGPSEAGTLTTYLIYGRLTPRETGRRIRPGQGREEIFFLINGRVRMLLAGGNEVEIRAGSAVPLKEGTDCWLSNLTDKPVEYIVAGGFTEPVHFLRQVQQQAGGRYL
ncbi:MAG: cupin domain-containing protein [Chloroflexi bacterium]|nr:cupin domain-containing protein [Chloroflexota bacterium]